MDKLSLQQVHVTNKRVEFLYDENPVTEITMRAYGDIDIDALDTLIPKRLANIAPEKVIVKCAYCGHWAAVMTECRKCGAPVDPERYDS